MKQRNFLLLEIVEIDIPVRMKNYLKKMGLVYVYQLVTLSSQDLKKKKNIGSKTIFETKLVLHEYGLSMDMHHDYIINILSDTHLTDEAVSSTFVNNDEQIILDESELSKEVYESNLTLDVNILSRRAINVLKSVEITTVRDFLNFKKDFIEISNCGLLTANELKLFKSRIVNKEINIQILDESELSKEVYESNLTLDVNILSRRAINVLKSVEITTVRDFLNFKKDFIEISNCGLLTANELKLFRSRIVNKEINIQKTERKVNCLFWSQCPIVYWGIGNKLNRIFKENKVVTCSDFVNFDIDSFEKNKSVGKNSFDKIIELRQKIFNIDSVYTEVDALDISENDIILEIIREPIFILVLMNAENHREKIQKSRIKDVLVTELVRRALSDFSGVYTLIAYQRILNSQKTLEEIGLAVNLTRERVRQIEKIILERMANVFSAFSHYFMIFFDPRIERNNFLDECSSLNGIFNSENDYCDFFKKIYSNNASFSFNIEQCFLGINDHEIKEVIQEVCLLYKNPLSEETFREYLLDKYILTQSQYCQFLSKVLRFGLIEHRENKIFLQPETKYLAVANVTLGFENGLPWKDIANIAKNQFKCAANIRIEHSPDQSISSNPYLYNSGLGIYKNLMYFKAKTIECNLIIQEISNYLASMRSKSIPLSYLRSQSDLLNRYNVYDLKYICKGDPTINIRTVSGQDLLIKNGIKDIKKTDLSEKVYSILIDSKSPWTSFEVASKIMKSKSVNHANLIISILKEKLLLFSIDNSRVATDEYIEDFLSGKKIDSLILEVIIKSDKIVGPGYLMEKVKSKINIAFGIDFFGSYSRKICREHNFSWFRGYCFRELLPERFSLRSMIIDLLSNDPSLTSNEVISLILKDVNETPERIKKIFLSCQSWKEK